MRILTTFESNPTRVVDWLDVFYSVHETAKQQEGNSRVIALHRGIPARYQAWFITKAKKIKEQRL